jgi:hypothetical protein
MFRSQVRPIVVPQYEHGRLTGILAQHWGNEQFDQPDLDFAAFVTGVALHDWHYGFGDTLPINGPDEAAWLAMTQRGVGLSFDDPTTDVVAKLHLRRLLTYGQSPERTAMIAEVDDIVAGRLSETGYSRAKFAWADKITRFCDNVAFHFSFEACGERTIPVSAHQSESAETTLTYHIEPDGGILVEPWPFSVPTINGYILGYEAEGYPQQLQPVMMPYCVYGRS